MCISVIRIYNGVLYIYISQFSLKLNTSNNLQCLKKGKKDN